MMSLRLRILIFSTVLIGIAGAILLLYRYLIQKSPTADPVAEEGYVGSRSCRECHERFYDLWSPSHHGKAMQPTADVLKNEGLALPDSSQKVGDHWFDVSINEGRLFMNERESENAEEVIARYEAQWALGGRNIYYFLTPFSGGRLQTMPLAYDINRKEWYSNPSSAVRHFVDDNISDEEIDWKHSLYTFNTTCHNCHVSQLQKNYNASTDTYHTTWKEPGINCETCHGPSEEHIRVCREAEKNNEVPDDLKIISVKAYSPRQHNAACASCHAKGTPLTQAYIPGEPFFQHFDLITLENPDYYPDGRDLGENYTMTSWLQSACLSNSDLSCITCHTSSGRYRYKGRDNEVCLSCHQDKSHNVEAHTHHKAEDKLTCVSCHMPETEFARMTRSDHSMRPPTPATTIAFGSPNACNICHAEENAQWADRYVREWFGDYQDDKLEISELIYKGRNNDFTDVDQMLAIINNPEIDVIFRNSMIRILANYPNKEKEAYLLRALQDSSPLIRGSAAEILGSSVNTTVKNALLQALKDSVLVVRIRASGSLAHFPGEMFTAEEWQRIERNYKEYEDFLMAYPDTWSAHYNIGRYYQGRGMYQQAVDSYEKAIQLEEEAIMPMVNASIAYSILGNNVMAEGKLQRALRLDPENSAVNLNYGLLLAETQRFGEAKKHLIRAYESDSTLSVAAYNLAVLSAKSSLSEALEYISRAYAIDPGNPKYGYTYAYYVYQTGARAKAVDVLNNVIENTPDYIDAYLFLANIYEETRNFDAAIRIYEKAASIEGIPVEYLQSIRIRTNQLKNQ